MDNKTNVKIPELLAPASGWDSLRAAVNGGADAVYAGGERFSARHIPEGFTDDDILRAVDYCHMRGVKLYAALNALCKDAELEEAVSFAARLYEAGADAFIVADMGLARALAQALPSARLHASTQMNAHDAQGAEFLARAGFERVVLARELALEDVAAINRAVDAETEVFAHGALCVCYSGQCLMSSMLGGRSGNRGRCAQVCRLPYALYGNGKKLESGYLLSPADMAALAILPRVAETGVAAIKIEGRMKSPEYVGLVTRVYRQQLDKVAAGKPFVASGDMEGLTQVFCRGGAFSQGYLTEYAGQAMMSAQTPKSTGLPVGSVLRVDPGNRVVAELTRELNPGDGVAVWAKDGSGVGAGVNRRQKAGANITLALDGVAAPGDTLCRTYDKKLMDGLKPLKEADTRKMDVNCAVAAKVGQPLTIRLWRGGAEAEFQGDVVEAAKERPVTREQLLERVGKTGGTPFTLAFGECDIDEAAFIAVGAINAARRGAVERFAEAYAEKFRRPGARLAYAATERPEHAVSKKLTVHIFKPELLEAVLQDGVAAVYMEVSDRFVKEADAVAEKAHSRGVSLYAALPRIDKPEGVSEGDIAALEASAIDGWLIRTHGQLKLLAGTAKRKTLDYSFNVTNGNTLAYYSELADVVTLSPELNLGEVNGLGGAGTEIIVHGRLPLMVTRQCPAGLFAAGKKGGRHCPLKGSGGTFTLSDRKGMVFPVMRDCGSCLAYILNSKTMFTLGEEDVPQRSAPGNLRLMFTVEEPEDAAAVVRAYAAQGKGGYDELIREYADRGVTHGHFHRGVD